MGFFRRLFGPERPNNNNNNNTSSLTAKDKKRWSFVKDRTTSTSASNNLHDASTSAQGWGGLDANKHAIAVAAATAAVSEAALAAAHAAAEVVRLTNGAGAGGNSAQISLPVSVPAHLSLHLAAVKIQSSFRRYLARRALRALKALVKLQALVRGYIVRKQTADMLRRMQTLVRVQARARASRSIMSESPHSTSKLNGPSILKRCGSNSNVRDAINVDRRWLASCWFDRWMEESVWNNRRDASLRYEQVDDEKGDKILEVDTWKPHLGSQRRTRTFQTAQNVVSSDHYNQSLMTLRSPSKHMTKEANLIASQASTDILSLRSLKYSIGKDEAALRTVQNSPQAFSASSRAGSSSRRGDFTPARSECSWGFFNGYADYPNYMANTESFRAKVRSQSVPRQRLEFEKYSFTKKFVQEFWDARTCSDLGFDADSRNEAFLGSTGFNRLGSANRR